MSRRVVRSAQSRADLADIWRHIARDDPRAARRFLERIDAVSRILAERPAIGRARPDLVADGRSFPVGRYLLIYRPLGDGLELLRVVHGARDLTRLF